MNTENLTKRKVRRINSDYHFIGTIVSQFTKIAGQERFVVEDDRGTLFIMSRKNFEVLADDEPVEMPAKWIKLTDRQPTEIDKEYHIKGRRGYVTTGYWNGEKFSFGKDTAVNFVEYDDLYWLED